MLLCHCKRITETATNEKENDTFTVTIDSTLRDTLKRNIEFVSDRYHSAFKTPIEARFFLNDILTDSIIQPDFGMMSWYSSHQDTIDLVAHVGGFETVALLLRFIGHKTTVWFYRAPHDTEGSKYFKINKEDSFSHDIEVPPARYKIELSEIPDTINRQVVFGHVSMESREYYDIRDSVEQKHKVKLKFFFRSQYKKFNY